MPDKPITKCAENANQMNDKPDSRQAPLVGFTKECVLSAEDHARYALKYLDEIIYHRLTAEEVIRNTAIAQSEVNKILDLLVKAKLAGKAR